MRPRDGFTGATACVAGCALALLALCHSFPAECAEPLIRIGRIKARAEKKQYGEDKGKIAVRFSYAVSALRNVEEHAVLMLKAACKEGGEVFVEDGLASTVMLGNM